MMTGEQLLAALQAMTPEQRALELVAGGHDDGWYYNVCSVKVGCVEKGQEVDPDEEQDPPPTPNVVIIECMW